MDTPFFNQIQQLAAKDTARFHVPGHKGNSASLAFMGEALFFDVTEVEGACDLSNPEGSLAQSQHNMAKAYGSGATLYSASGSTSCIQAMLTLFVGMGGRVVMARNCHVAAVRAIAFLDADPTWLTPEEGPPTSLQINDALRESGAKAVYITSPDYYGRIADIPAISTVCKKYNAALLVDNAHGAHLRFMEQNLHPISLGADATADSAHKTLPCLTPAALLHLNDASLAGAARQVLNLYSSTSPSYLVLQSLDIAAGRLLAGDIPFIAAAKQLADAAKTFSHLLQPGQDPLKLCLRPAQSGWLAEEINQALLAAGIYPELADKEHIVLMASPSNTKEDYQRLADILHVFTKKEPIKNEIFHFQPINKACSIRKALFAPSETLPVQQAVGRVCASLAVPCPPGMPIVLPGEIISQTAAVQYLTGGIPTLNVLK